MACSPCLASPIIPTIVVHGGAGTYATIVHDNASKKGIEDGVSDAARAGYAVLTAGGSTLDAVQSAVISMENNPIFNAGRGSCLTIDGEIEMDACIMDGATLRAGGVACIRNVANPIVVARLVMEKSDHVMFCGDGALNFAKKHGVEEVPFEYLVTEKSKRRLANFPTFQPSVKVEFYEHSKPASNTNNCCQATGEDHDTVGAVAIDAAGNVAFATSTGGITAKQTGRVGDSPIVGCGGYADNVSGAVSTTGHGESFMRTCMAKYITDLMEQGRTAQHAAEAGIEMMSRRVKGDGGCIAVDRSGNVGVHFNVEGMAWACCRSSVLHHGIYPGEDFTQPM